MYSFLGNQVHSRSTVEFVMAVWFPEGRYEN
jgi:hypothetical protein